ncbi:MAG: hypothetical protein JXR84_21715 [Anaerolineae bacterium]|nr:hypothetical protein [Anaerolineae bacterium]
MKAKVYWRYLCGLVVMGVVGGLALPVFVSAYQGMVSTNYRIPWSALSAGGQTMASAGFQIQGTITCNFTGAAASDAFQVNAGYWPGLFSLTGRNANRVVVETFHATQMYVPFAIGALIVVLAALAVTCGRITSDRSGRSSKEAPRAGIHRDG